MPFDGRTYKKVHTELPEITVQEFYDWVKTKDPNETYSYLYISDCAVTQFLMETGKLEAYGY